MPLRQFARFRGFTLIELLIAMVVVSVLLAVALPSYRSQARKSTRAEAQAYMMAVAARQQQFLVDTRAFATLGDVGVAQPANVTKGYTLTLTQEAGPPPGFQLTATPLGDQAYDPCGTLVIDQNGTRTATTTGCW